MKRIVTHKTVIKTVAEQYRQQYEPTGWMTTVNGPTRPAYDRLLALPESATDDDVADVIGNSGWTSIGCSECDKKGVLIRMGHGSTKHNDCSYAWICKGCLEEALALTQAPRRKKQE